MTIEMNTSDYYDLICAINHVISMKEEIRYKEVFKDFSRKLENSYYEVISSEE